MVLQYKPVNTQRELKFKAFYYIERKMSIHLSQWKIFRLRWCSQINKKTS